MLPYLDLSVRYRTRLPIVAESDVKACDDSLLPPDGTGWYSWLKNSWDVIEQKSASIGFDIFEVPASDIDIFRRKLLLMGSVISNDTVSGESKNDVEKVLQKDLDYGASWKKRGGLGAMMMLCRKWDRICFLMEKVGQSSNLLELALKDSRAEGVKDDISDLRRYLLLVSSELLFRRRLARKKTKSGCCELCGVYRVYLDRDHITPRWRGGSDDPSNIQNICQNCHADKSRDDLRGFKHSEDSRAKMRAASKVFWASEAGRLAKLNISKAQKGRPGHNLGKKLRESTKQKLRLSQLGRKASAEARRKMSQRLKGNKHLLGHVHAEETRVKISKSLIGNKHLLGHKHSAKSRKKMSDSQKRRYSK